MLYILNEMLVRGLRSKIGLHPGWMTLCSDNTDRRLHSRTCGIIVSGDEVLKGEVQDTNSHFLSKQLHDLGIKVLKISSVPDDVDAISAEVKKFSEDYDYVLTTGGIGPTHDDVTYESVAKAFNVGLRHHEVLLRICFDFYKTNDVSHPAMKLARVPETARLTFGIDEDTKKPPPYPNVSVRNVYIFPGVPHMMMKLFLAVRGELFATGMKFHLRDLYLNAREDMILSRLNETVCKFPMVTFGSYPKFFHSYYTLRLTVESTSEASADDAFRYLKSGIPEHLHVDYDGDYTRDKGRKLKELRNRSLDDAINNLKSALSSADPNDVFLYFDGGKNSTLLLYILSMLKDEHFGDQPKMNCVHVEGNSKVLPFVEESCRVFNVNLIKLSRRNFRRFFLSDPDMLLVKGTRRSDPEAESIFKAFEGLNVLNPLLNWEYKDVWDVIRGVYAPYCPLYDQGYSSICRVPAKPNPHLLTTGPREDLVYYKKAHELEDGSLENC